MTTAITMVRLVHRVRLRHTATGMVLEPVTARGVLPYGWAMRVRGGDVVVTARDGVPVPLAAPVITVSISDRHLAALVQTPSVDVPLDTADITLDVDPAPITLDVVLSAPTTGLPRTGLVVTARAGSGPTPRPTVPLAESEPGVYSSGPVVWTAAFTPFDLLVGGVLLRRLALDHTRSSTRIRLVDTT